MLNFKCPRCGKKFSTKPEAAGRRTRCPKCSNPFRIPLPIDVPVSDIPIPLIEASEKKAGQENESSSMDNLCEISHKNNPGKQIFKTWKEQFKTKKIIIIGGFIFLLILFCAIIGFIAEQSAEGHYKSAVKAGLLIPPDNNRALIHLTKVIDKDPNFKGKQGSAISLRGITYFQLGKYQASIADLTTSIEMEDPSKQGLFFFRGRAYMQIGKYQEAIDDLTEAINLSSKDREKSGSYLARGEAYAQQKKYQMAIYDYDESERLNPIPSKVLKTLGHDRLDKLREKAYKEMGKQP